MGLLSYRHFRPESGTGQVKLLPRDLSLEHQSRSAYVQILCWPESLCRCKHEDGCDGGSEHSRYWQ